jgi:type 2 lantibiotic biosynthesis protein LanM
MIISNKQIIEIVVKASTITERLENNFTLGQAPINDDTINSRIDDWCQAVADGNQEKFAKRLAWDGLELNNIQEVLGTVHLIDEQNLPSWTETFKDAIEATGFFTGEMLEERLQENILNPQKPLPFEELFLPFIYVAQRKLKAEADSSYSLLSRASHANLEYYLLESLTSLCSQAMGIEFQIFRVYEQPTLVRRLEQLQDSHPREQYNKFIHKMLSGELVAFFQEYSVLARLTATVTDFWVNNTCEFIQRLKSDWSAIQTTFHNNVDIGQVIAVETGLSDLHHNGRSVLGVTFASGLKLIYKPKDLNLEETFFQLLATLNEKGISPPLKLLQILNRSNYGWVEYVEYLPCRDQQAAMRYYQRSGMLLCILYALSGIDFHQENVIACGEHPVLIDLEMLMAAKASEEESCNCSGGDNTNASNLAYEQFTYSVLSTNFLPRWELGRDGSVYDISGLGGNGGQKTDFRTLVWRHINTDGMFLSHESSVTKISQNIPILNGVNLSPNNYIEEIVDGFRTLYKFLITHRETLLAPSSLLAKLANQRVRSLFRPSQVYARLIKNSLQPKYLGDGVAYSIALDVLSKSLLKFETKPHIWQIIAAEKQALMHLDIPLFATYPQSRDLKITSSEFITGYFTESGYNVVINRLQQLCLDDLEQQIGFVRSSLYTSIANNIESPQMLTEQPTLDINTTRTLPQFVLVQQAVDIAQELQKRAIRAADGSVTWMGMDYIPESGRLQQIPMSYDFYDGSSGVALFLAAVSQVTNSEEFRDLAIGALQPIRKLSHNSNSMREQAIIRKMNIGGGKGLGSIIYTLVRCSQFLEEPIILKDAEELAKRYVPPAIPIDEKFDIVSGTAGTILGLLALYNITKHSVVIDLATSCGYHLVSRRVKGDTGYHTWATINGKLLTGISHGAAGIAYALLRLYEVVGNSIFLQAALEAIAYERSVYDTQSQNWPDFRGEKPGFGITWCHGAPGIGLARMGSLSILDTAEIRQEIEVALQTTQKFCLQDIDHLCCGNFGRIDMLLVAAQKLKQPELFEIAQKHATFVVNKAEKIGYFQIFPRLYKDIYNPGFFQGTAGIGYELLRVAYPEKLPSTLLWQ